MSTIRWSRKGLVGVVFAVLLGWGSSAHAATQSATWQVDPSHDGYEYGAGVLPPLREAWSDDLSHTNTYVAIDDGQAFAFAGDGSSTAAYIDAIDLTTGAATWRREISPQGGVDMYLAVDGGKVFTAVDGTDPPGSSSAALILSAFDEQTGAQIWSEALDQNSDPTPPVVRDGTLYFDAEGRGGYVFAVSESDGAVRWRTGRLLLGNSVTLAADKVVISGPCGLAYGLNAANGDLLWNDSDNCDGGGLLMSSFDGTDVWGEATGDNSGGGPGWIYDPGTGRVVSRFPGYTPAFGYGEAVQTRVDSSGASAVEAFDPSTQAVRWSFAVPTGGGSPIGGTPLLADGYVFTEGGGGDVWALDPCSGTVVWHGQTGASAPYDFYNSLPGLAAGEGYLLVPTVGGLTAFKGSGAPSGSAVKCPSTSSPGPVPPSVAAAPSAAPSSSRATAQSKVSGLSPTLTRLRISCTPPRVRDITIVRGRCSVRVRSARSGLVAARLTRDQRTVASNHSGGPRGMIDLTLRLPAVVRRGRYQLALTLKRDGHLLASLTQPVRLSW